MKTRRKTTKKKHCKEGGHSSPLTPPPPPPSPCNLQTLIQVLLRNSEGLNQLPLLKSLYAFLVQLSSQVDAAAAAASTKVDFTLLVGALFGQLHTRFQHLFSAFCNVDSVSASQQQSRILSSICASSKEFALLLRCCLVIITLPQLSQTLVLDKGIFLLSVFTRLRSLHVIGVGINEDEIRIRSQKSTFLDGLTSSVDEDFVASLSFLKPSYACLPFLCDLLEVFADEFVVHKSLRENLMLFDCLSSHDTLFANHLRHGDVRNVMELIACHFILSFSDEQVCDRILNRLSWHCRTDRKVTQLGMDQCVLLLLDSNFLSAPDIFQSHLLLMVSEAIGIDSACLSSSPDVRLMNCYLLAFERSVILYTIHIHALRIDGGTNGVSRPDLQAHGKSLHSSFDVFIRPTTRHHFDQLLSKLDNHWPNCAKNATRHTKSELLSTSFAYIEENKGLFSDRCKGKMLSFMQALIMVASEEVNDSASCKKVEASLQQMFLVASILKSMSASLLQAIRCLENFGEVGNLKMLKDFPESKEYDFIVHVITCFQKLNDCLPLARDPLACYLSQGNKAKHTESKQMLLHFCCFLSLGFRYKIEFLVKGCIFTLMTLLNLIIFEDGHLDSVNPLLVYLSGASADSFRGELDETQSHPQNIRKSSHVVASKFQKIKTLCSSQSSRRFCTDVAVDDSNDETSIHVEEETCSGKIYLNCIFENSKIPPDVDDLSNFIECKSGKDYSEWLKEREKYRKWKVHKMAVLRWEKRKRTWHSIKGMKS